MSNIAELVDTVRTFVSPFVRWWLALETDYKSVTVAFGLVGLVVGFDVRIPW